MADEAGGAIADERLVPGLAAGLDDGLLVGRDRLGELGEEGVHRGGADMCADRRLAGIALRTDDAEDPGGAEAMIAHRPGPAPLGVPDPGRSLPSAWTAPVFPEAPPLGRLGFMEARTLSRPYPSELRERAVRLVRELEVEHGP